MSIWCAVQMPICPDGTCPIARHGDLTEWARTIEERAEECGRTR
jgi:hypothetical protein